MRKHKERNKTMANEFENLRLGIEEFGKAMKESLDKWSKEFEKIGEQIKVDFPFTDFADMGEEYSGVIRLPYSPTGAWSDAFNILALHGYAVSAEVETEDGEQYVVIAFERVER